jgi:hypothetical protein
LSEENLEENPVLTLGKLSKPGKLFLGCDQIGGRKQISLATLHKFPIKENKQNCCFNFKVLNLNNFLMYLNLTKENEWKLE